MSVTGRPKIDREQAFAAIAALPRVGRRQVRLNSRSLAAKIGCNRGTVGVIVSDLESQGRLRRRWVKGRGGVILELLN